MWRCAPVGDVVANIYTPLHGFRHSARYSPHTWATHLGNTPGQEGARGKVSPWAGEGHSSSELQAGGRQPPRGKPVSGRVRGTVRANCRQATGNPLAASPPGESDLALHGQEPGQVGRDVQHLKLARQGMALVISQSFSSSWSASYGDWARYCRSPKQMLTQY